MQKNRTITTLAAAIAFGLLAAGCAQGNRQTASADVPKGGDQTVKAAEMGSDIKEAIAVIHGTRGNQKVQGTVKFTEAPGPGGPRGVNVVAHIEGLSPNSTHGFHIHEFGDCSAPDATSAGGHYNPTGAPHGAPGPKTHIGDMGNLKSNAQGVAHLEINLPEATIAGKNAILGRGVIVHAKADDLKSQPSGDAGARIGCGVIGVAQSKK